MDRRWPRGARRVKIPELLQRTAGKSPRFLIRRAAREIGRAARARLLPRRLERISASEVAAQAGFRSPREFWVALAGQGFFLSAADAALMRALYRERYRAEAVALREAAERAMRHEFDLLGSGPTDLGPRIDWHRDFKSGRRWPLVPAHSIGYAELDGTGDVKVAWELSRGQYLTALAQAWVIFEDERYVREIEAQIGSWLEANPVGMGVNWACTMDVALRTVSWLWALKLLGPHALTAGVRERVIRALYQHGWWIAKNLEVSDVNGNHYIADALGLVACGRLFSSTARGRGWWQSGARILEQEIRLQVEDDGVDFEASIPYHRLTTEIFLVGERLLAQMGLSVSAEYSRRLARMLDFIDAYITPEGLAPVIGDADDGRALVLGRTAIRDHRYLLAAGSVMFGRPQWKARAGKFWEDALWLLGPQELTTFDAMPAQVLDEASRGFSQGGFYILRSPDQYLIADLGPVGFRGRGGHGHNDCLSFEWHALRRPLLTDSGAFAYTDSPKWRNLFRSTAFHNTVRIDGEEINRFYGPLALWSLHDDAQPLEVRFQPAADRDLLSGGHCGYRRLPGEVGVFRSFDFSRIRPEIQITDRITGAGLHRMEFFFHGAVGATARPAEKGGVTLIWADGVCLRITPDSPAITWRIEEGWFSPSYGIKQARPVWVGSVTAELPFAVRWSFTLS